MTNNEEGDSKLAQQLAELEWDKEPSHDLWTDISSRIRFISNKKDIKKQTVRWMPAAIAASLILALVSVFFSYGSFIKSNELDKHRIAMASYQQAQLALIEQQHKMVRVQFSTMLEQQADSLSPGCVRAVKMLMADIDSASNEIKMALSAQPNNPDFTSLLVRTYQQEIKALSRFKNRSSGLSNSLPNEQSTERPINPESETRGISI